MVLCGTAPSQTPLPDPQDSILSETPLSDFQWFFDAQALAYGNVVGRNSNSPLNPGNAYAGVPGLTLTGEFRPNIRAISDDVDLVLHPRLTSVYQEGGVNERESVRGFIQEGYVRARPDDDVSVTVGRELMTWGPAFFRSPSNPYYFNNARMDPIIELSGIDLARLSYSVGSEWTVNGGVVFDSGQDLVPGNPYRGSLLLKGDYRGPNYLGSLILATLRSQQVFVGGYAQANVSDAILAYGEFGSSSSNTGLNTLSPGSTGSFTPSVSGRREATALGGASYTFQNGQSIYAEYLYNGYGYSGSGQQRFFTQAGSAGNELLMGGSLSALAAQTVGLAASRSQYLLGQHYLYLQYQNSPAQGDTIWRLMAAQNLVDHSAQLSVYLEHNLISRASLFALGILNIGPRSSEFDGTFGKSVMTGLKLFIY